MTGLRVAAFTMTALLLSISPALAGGGTAGDLEVGVFGGMVEPDSYEPLNPEGGPLFGVRLGLFITDTWNVEISWQTAGLDGEYLGADTDVDLEALRVNALYNFRPGERLRWFLTAGLGEESVDADDVPMHEQSLGFNTGAGVRYYLGEKKRFGLRGTGRFVFVDPGGGVQGSQTDFEATGGISISFGLGN